MCLYGVCTCFVFVYVVYIFFRSCVHMQCMSCIYCVLGQREGLKPRSKMLGMKQSAVWNVAATGVILVLEYGPRGREKTWGKEHFHILKMGTTLGDQGLPSGVTEFLHL